MSRIAHGRTSVTTRRTGFWLSTLAVVCLGANVLFAATYGAKPMRVPGGTKQDGTLVMVGNNVAAGVYIDRGSRDDVKLGQQLFVYRGKEILAVGAVEQVFDGTSAVRILQIGAPLRRGDTYQFYPKKGKELMASSAPMILPNHDPDLLFNPSQRQVIIPVKNAQTPVPGEGGATAGARRRAGRPGSGGAPGAPSAGGTPSSIVSITSQSLLAAPDGKAVKHSLFTMQLLEERPIESWTLEVDDPTNRAVWAQVGKDRLPSNVDWDGKTDDGRVVDNATDCTYHLTVKFMDGNSVTVGDKISAGIVTEISQQAPQNKSVEAMAPHRDIPYAPGTTPQAQLPPSAGGGLVTGATLPAKVTGPAFNPSITTRAELLTPGDTRVKQVAFVLHPTQDSNTIWVAVSPEKSRIQSWKLVVTDPDGNIVWTNFGRYDPPNVMEWDGRTEDGLVVKNAALSRYHFQARLKDGNVVDLSGGIMQPQAAPPTPEPTEAPARSLGPTAPVPPVYRGPIVKVDVKTETLSESAGTLRRAVFTFQSQTAEPIVSWQLDVLDSQGRVVRSYNGTDLPQTQEWDGKRETGWLVKNAMDGSYNLVLKLRNGESQTVSGRFKGELTTTQAGMSKTAPMPTEEARPPVVAPPPTAAPPTATPPATYAPPPPAPTSPLAAAPPPPAAPPAAGGGQTKVSVSVEKPSPDSTIVRKATFTFAPAAGDAVTSWNLDIVDADGRAVNSFSGQQLPTEPLVWDGKRNTGWIVKNGVGCQYTLTVQYRSGKSQTETGGFTGTSATNAAPPPAAPTESAPPPPPPAASAPTVAPTESTSVPAASPSAPAESAPAATQSAIQMQVQTDILSPKRLTVKRAEFTFGAAAGPVANWQLEIVDETGKTVRQYTGEGNLPASLKWDGKDEDGWLVSRGAACAARLTVKYTDGKQDQATIPVSTNTGG